MRDSNAKERALQGENETGAGGSALDNIANYATPPPENHEKRGLSRFDLVVQALPTVQRPSDEKEAYLERFELQSAGRVIMGKEHRIFNCLRATIAGRYAVTVRHRADIGRASLGQLQTCGSVWACPVCSAKITNERRGHLQTLTLRHWERGFNGERGGLLLLTRTIPHGAGDSLEKLNCKLSEADRLFRMGKPYKKTMDRWGVVGYARSKEITIGRHGFHPHCHDLLLTAGTLPPPEVEHMEEELFTLWASACRRAGLGEISRQAFSLQNGNRAASYVTKFGIEWELTGQNSKKGRNGSLTPFDLLRVYSQSNDENAVHAAATLFREYVRHTKGKRYLTYSRGLLSSYGITDKEDPEIAQEEDPVALLLGLISLPDWKNVLSRGSRSSLLAVASAGDWAQVRQYLDALKPPPPGKR